MLPWDGVINLLAAVGVGAFAVHMLVPARRDRLPNLLEIRFGTLAVLSAFFMAARGLFWISDFWPFLVMSHLAVCWVPLGILLAVEGLLRRHAPLPLKLFAVVGGVSCTTLVFLLERDAAALFSMSLALFQVLGLVLPFAWAFARNRSVLSKRENQRIDSMVTLTLVGLPFIVTDFSDLLPALPLSMGAIAILLFAYAAILAARFPTRNPVLSWRFLNLVALALIAAALVMWLTDLSGLSAFVRLAALVLTLAVLLALLLELLSLRDQSEERALLRTLSALDLSRPEAAVSRLIRFSPFEHASLIRPGQGPVPADFNIEPGRVFHRTPATNQASDLRAAAVLESVGADLMFLLDPKTDALCMVEIHDPGANTVDWARVIAALASSKARSA